MAHDPNKPEKVAQPPPENSQYYPNQPPLNGSYPNQPYPPSGPQYDGGAGYPPEKAEKKKDKDKEKDKDHKDKDHKDKKKKKKKKEKKGIGGTLLDFGAGVAGAIVGVVLGEAVGGGDDGGSSSSDSD